MSSPYQYLGSLDQNSEKYVLIFYICEIKHNVKQKSVWMGNGMCGLQTDWKGLSHIVHITTRKEFFVVWQ